MHNIQPLIPSLQSPSAETFFGPPNSFQRLACGYTLIAIGLLTANPSVVDSLVIDSVIPDLIALTSYSTGLAVICEKFPLNNPWDGIAVICRLAGLCLSIFPTYQAWKLIGIGLGIPVGIATAGLTAFCVAPNTFSRLWTRISCCRSA
ncbi:MAG: hypothetical protein V4487_00920 [Chlamydiota bacterium]